MKTGLLRLAFFGYLTLLFVGCNQVVAPNTPMDVTLSPTETQPSSVLPQGNNTQMTPTLPSPTASGLQNLIEKAKGDLAQRLSISADQISFVEAGEVEWSDSSLDCPQPGMEYLQVITPGYRILLESSGNVYEYHSNRDTYIVYCENSIPLVPPPKP